MQSLRLGVYSLGVYSLAVYSLGVYNLVQRDLELEMLPLGFWGIKQSHKGNTTNGT